MGSRILQIDDDPAIRDIVASTLSHDAAFTVVTCASGAEGLAVAATWMPHLVLCDVEMPGMHGTTVLEQLRQNADTAHIPLIFATARAEPGEAAELMQLGAAGVIVKPFKLKHLAQTLRDHLDADDAEGGNASVVATTYDFAARLRADVATLEALGRTLTAPQATLVPDGLQLCVHNLAGAASSYEFQSVSLAASAVEDTIIEHRVTRGETGQVKSALDALLACMRREL